MGEVEQVEVRGIGQIVGHGAEPVRRLVAIGQQRQFAPVRQFEVQSGLYLRGGSVLHVLRVGHLIHLCVIVQHLLTAVLWHVVGCHAVGIFLVGIEVVQSGCLRVHADAAAHVEPLGERERQVQSGRQGSRCHVRERLHGGEAQSGSGAQAVHLVQVPRELILGVGCNLVQSGNVAERTRTTVAVRAQGARLVGIVVAASAVPVEVIVGSHLKALSRLAPSEVELVAHLGIHVARAAFGLAGGQIGTGLERHVVVARLACGENGQQARTHTCKRRRARVGAHEAHAYSIR